MSFTNNHRPPSPPPPLDLERHLHPGEPYDINFAFPLHAEALESPRVRLTPFDMYSSADVCLAESSLL